MPIETLRRAGEGYIVTTNGEKYERDPGDPDHWESHGRDPDSIHDIPIKMKARAKLLVVLVLFGVLAYSSSHVYWNRAYYNSARDIFDNIVFIFEDRTIYAPGYSEEGFKTIARGMSREQVLAILGEPLRRDLGTSAMPKEYWRYTEGTADSNYWFRTITFDKKGIVQGVDRHYFVD
jgi:hypothetical protein